MTRVLEPAVSTMLPPLRPLAAGPMAAPTGDPSTDPTPARPPVPMAVVAARLRWFRTERGLRLEDVAKRAGYTKGFLSKIEHGKASPPLATLLRVAAALGVEADVLLAPDAGVAPDASVCTAAGQGVLVRDEGAGPGRTLLAIAAARHHKLMEPFVVTLDAGQASNGQPTNGPRHTCPGEEFIYVLEGDLEYVVGDETFHLKPGDALYFNASKPNAAVARGGTARYLRVFCASPARRSKYTEEPRG